MILSALIWISLAVGLTFNALGVIGILRFPDVYTRLHADTKATTFGSIFTSLAVVLYAAGEFFKDPEGQYETLALHTVLAVVVLAFTNATSAHAIARAAHKRGHKPAQAVCDRLEETAK
ncbi:MAG: cation:proton antiporter [Spartobacteria bacterium]|nr:cation:proton antiporter [Spartobacteria bacterium]